MKHLKTFEYQSSIYSKVDRLISDMNDNLIVKIQYNSELGITPQEYLELDDTEYKYFINSLDDKNQVIIRDANKTADYYKSKTKLQNTDEENKQFFLSTIIDGLKNGIPMKDTINKEFKGINVDDLLISLTDKDRNLINKYQKELSNTSDNIDKYNSGIETDDNYFLPNVSDPNEPFYNSYLYKKYHKK